MSEQNPDARPPLYYEARVCCPFCPDRPFKCRLVAEVEPPPDAVVPVRCPNDSMPFRIPFHVFKPCEPFEPQPWQLHYPPRPESPPEPYPTQPPRKWWQFWKW